MHPIQTANCCGRCWGDQLQSCDPMGVATLIQGGWTHENLATGIGVDFERQVLKPFVFTELFPGKHGLSLT